MNVLFKIGLFTHILGLILLPPHHGLMGPAVKLLIWPGFLLIIAGILKKEYEVHTKLLKEGETGQNNSLT